MKLGVLLPIDYGFSVGEHIEFAQQAEAGALGAVFAGEVAGYDPFVLLAAIGARTDRITLGTAIASIYARPPASTAGALLALASAVDPDRVIGGIGASSPVIVDGWHGMSYDRPVTRAAEYLHLLRGMLAGERSDFSGEVLRSIGFRAGVAPAAVPLYLGAFGPRMLRLAAAQADGVITGLVRPAVLPQILSQLSDASNGRGNTLGPLNVVASGLRVYAGPEPERARAHLRRLLLGYAMVPTHRPLFADCVPELDSIQERWDSGDRAGALDLFGDAAVDAFCVVGARDEIAVRLGEFAATGIDQLLVHPVGHDTSDVDGCRESMAALCAAARSLPRAPARG